MPAWLTYVPKIKVPIPFVGDVAIEPSLASTTGGPPVSAERFQRARQIAAETIELADRDNLEPAAQRLLALAAEFPVADRKPAVEVANKIRTLNEVSAKLSAEEFKQQSTAAFNELIATVAQFRTAADVAEGATTDLDPPVRERDDQRDGVFPRAPGAPPLAGDGSAPAVTCDAVCWRAGGKPILRGVDLELAPGSVVGVVGRNGAGKTTLLRLLAQEIRPSSGEVAYPDLAQRQYRAERLLDRIAYVPQTSTPYPGRLETHLSSFAALRGLRGKDLTGEVAFAIERFGLGGLASAQWGELSGGFRTRVDLARATLAAPAILILDEPLGPLDSRAQREYLRYLGDLARSSRGVCVVVTSQDVHAISEVADHIVVLSDGALQFTGAPDDIEHMFHRRSYEFAVDLAADELMEVLTRLDRAKVHDRGTTQLLVTGPTTSAREVLSLLLSHCGSVRYFRDLSRSPEQLLDDPDTRG